MRRWVLREHRQRRSLWWRPPVVHEPTLLAVPGQEGWHLRTVLGARLPSCLLHLLLQRLASGCLTTVARRGWTGGQCPLWTTPPRHHACLDRPRGGGGGEQRGEPWGESGEFASRASARGETQWACSIPCLGRVSGSPRLRGTPPRVVKQGLGVLANGFTPGAHPEAAFSDAATAGQRAESSSSTPLLNYSSAAPGC